MTKQKDHGQTLRWLWVCLIIGLAGAGPAQAQRDRRAPWLIDAHLHYIQGDAEALGAEAIITTLRRAGVGKAVITSTPPELVLQLYDRAPERVVPLLGVYRTPADKGRWHRDVDLPARVERALRDRRWRGVGELHIFAEHRHSPVFLAIVDLATERGLPILLHADPAVVDRLYDHNPHARVVWAHAGAYPFPPLLHDYLRRYPNLYLDLSVRDDRIAPDGELDDAWEDFIIEHSDRLLIGVDTFWTPRWYRYRQALAVTEAWLSEFPDDIRDQLAYRNAERIYVD